MKRLLTNTALAASLALGVGGPETAFSSPDVTTTAERRTTWGIGKQEWTIVEGIGDCSLLRGGMVEKIDDELQYTGRDRYQVGAECPDGSIINPAAVNLDAQNAAYTRAAEELQQALESDSTTPMGPIRYTVNPINTEDSPFRRQGEPCRIVSGSTVYNMGHLGTGDIVVKVAAFPKPIPGETAHAPDRYACQPKTVFLMQPDGSPAE